MAQQQERCGAAFDLDGLTLRWYTHRGAAHQVGPSLRELECITDLAHLLLEAGETAFTQRVVAVGIHATSILEAGLARTAFPHRCLDCGAGMRAGNEGCNTVPRGS